MNMWHLILSSSSCVIESNVSCIERQWKKSSVFLLCCSLSLSCRILAYAHCINRVRSTIRFRMYCCFSLGLHCKPKQINSMMNVKIPARPFTAHECLAALLAVNWARDVGDISSTRRLFFIYHWSAVSLPLKNKVNKQNMHLAQRRLSFDQLHDSFFGNDNLRCR